MFSSFLGALAVILSMLNPVASPAPQQPAAPRFDEYVALGDSWSADVVLADLNGLPDTTHVPTGCAQSHVNYPKLLARHLGVKTFRDATCGSATTRHFFGPQGGLPTGETNPPQFDRLTRSTDLVTVGVGGNDAGFASAAISCINLLPTNVPQLSVLKSPLSIPLFGDNLPLGGCKHNFVKGGRDLLAERIAASEVKLVRALQEIRKRSPQARILMIDYLYAIPPKGCYPTVPVTDTDVAYLHETFKKLNAMVKRAAARGGAEFVNTYLDSIGHDVCQPPNERYVEGLGVLSLNGPAIAVPAHPNSAGAASQFRSLRAHLSR